MLGVSPESRWMRLGSSDDNRDRLTSNSYVIYPTKGAGFLSSKAKIVENVMDQMKEIQSNFKKRL